MENVSAASDPETGSIVSSAPSSVHSSRRPSSSSCTSRTRFCSGIGSVTTARSPSSTTRNSAARTERADQQVAAPDRKALALDLHQVRDADAGQPGVHRLLEADVMTLLLAQRPDQRAIVGAVGDLRASRSSRPARADSARRRLAQRAPSPRCGHPAPHTDPADCGVRACSSQSHACADRCAWSCRNVARGSWANATAPSMPEKPWSPNDSSSVFASSSTRRPPISSPRNGFLPRIAPAPNSGTQGWLSKIVCHAPGALARSMSARARVELRHAHDETLFVLFPEMMGREDVHDVAVDLRDHVGDAEAPRLDFGRVSM